MTQLEDLFVKEEARNMGIGKAFFAELGRIALDKVHNRGNTSDFPTNRATFRAVRV